MGTFPKSFFHGPFLIGSICRCPDLNFLWLLNLELNNTELWESTAQCFLWIFINLDFWRRGISIIYTTRPVITKHVFLVVKNRGFCELFRSESLIFSKDWVMFLCIERLIYMPENTERREMLLRLLRTCGKPSLSPWRSLGVMKMYIQICSKKVHKFDN